VAESAATLATRESRDPLGYCKHRSYNSQHETAVVVFTSLESCLMSMVVVEIQERMREEESLLVQTGQEINKARYWPEIVLAFGRKLKIGTYR